MKDTGLLLLAAEVHRCAQRFAGFWRPGAGVRGGSLLRFYRSGEGAGLYEGAVSSTGHHSAARSAVIAAIAG